MFGMRYLSIDLGDRRTGLAVGDRVLKLASPVDVLEVPIERGNGGALLDAIAAAVIEHLGPAKASPGELVLGLPLNMDGSSGPRAALVRAFAARLAERTGRVVHLFDERLTSAAADWMMAGSGLTHKQKKHRRDALAAAATLQSFLNQLDSDTQPPDLAGGLSGTT